MHLQSKLLAMIAIAWPVGRIIAYQSILEGIGLAFAANNLQANICEAINCKPIYCKQFYWMHYLASRLFAKLFIASQLFASNYLASQLFTSIVIACRLFAFYFNARQ